MSSMFKNVIEYWLGTLVTILLILLLTFVVISGNKTAPIIDIDPLEQIGKFETFYSKRLSQLESQLRELQSLGATIPEPVADFETSLASSISDTDTTMTLVSFATDDGTNLVADRVYGFTVDSGTLKEHVIGTASTSNQIVNMTRGVSVITGTTSVTALKKDHRRGRSVRITDAPVILTMAAILNGKETIPNVLVYESGTGCGAGSASTTLCDKNYIDNVGLQGAATSSESQGGIVRLATQLQMASSTDLGANDPLVAQAKFGTSTPDGTSASGLFYAVTQNNGKLHQLFLDLTETFTYTGQQTWNAAINIFTNAAPRVGIGTTTPYAPLSVVGEVVASNFSATSTTATSTFASGIDITDTGFGLRFPSDNVQTDAYRPAFISADDAADGCTAAPTGAGEAIVNSSVTVSGALNSKFQTILRSDMTATTTQVDEQNEALGQDATINLRFHSSPSVVCLTSDETVDTVTNGIQWYFR